MNKLLRRTMDENVPQFSKEVTEGTVKEVFESIPEYLDRVFRSSVMSLNKSINLKYIGYEFVNPEEEFYSVYGGNKTNSPDFDLAHSDVYPIKFHFTFDGNPIEQTILLPYARSGNIFMISGTKYVVSPVLTDTVITPQARQIFVRLLKGKLTFDCKDTNFVYNGQTCNGLLIWSKIMKNSVKTGSLGKPLSPTSLYLMGKYGFKGTLNKYLPKEVGKLMKRSLKPDDILITTEDSPKLREKYNVYESTGIKPSEVKVKGEYVGHNIKIYIHKDIPQTSFIRHLFFGIIYALDVLPFEAHEILELINSGDVENETYKWKMMLGNIDYKGFFSHVKVSNDILEHFNNIEYYVDSIIKEQLQEVGIYVDNFFDLLYYIMRNFSDWTLSAKYYNSDIKNSYIDIKYYICHDIIIGFNKVILNLNQRVNKVKEHSKPIRENEVINFFNGEFKKKIIYSLVKSNKRHLNIQGGDYSGCLKYPKATSILEHQSRGDGVKASVNSKMPEAMRTISGSHLVIGSILFLSKQAQSGLNKANIYSKYNKNTGRYIIDDFLQSIITKVDSQLQGKLPEVFNQELVSHSDDDDVSKE